VLLQQVVPACIALAILLPIIVGEFDLSAGYTLGLTAVVAAKWGDDLGLGGPGAMGLALVFGALVGLVNGILVAVFRFGSLIATLGVGLTVSGLSVGISDSQTISSGIPPLIGKVTTNTFLGLASAVWITLGLAVVLYLLIAHTPFGRRMFATGANEQVALLAGVRTSQLKIIAFVLAGLLAAVAGLFQVGLSGAANPGYGANLLLPAFAAVFLGSTAIRPGTFNVWGTVLAILILAAGFSGLSLVGVPFWVEPVFDGLVLIVAVFFSRGRGRTGAF
jgi:ribose transport system permease protein